MSIIIKSAREIELMREAGRIVAQSHEIVKELAKPNTTTLKLDQEVKKFVTGLGGILTFKGYRGYPANICTSINEEVVHGIPSKRRLREGDILSVDIGVKYNNYCGDAAMTIPIGEISEKAKRVVEVCKNTLNIAVETIRPGIKLYALSSAIQNYVEGCNFSVVKQYVGHGIGYSMHEDPQIPNFVSDNFRDYNYVLQPGMVLAVEPMVNEGESEVKVSKNGWTVVTSDGKLSAHFEHSIAVTEEGSRVLTLL